MRTSFHHQPEAQHPKFFSYPQAAGRLPHLWRHPSRCPGGGRARAGALHGGLARLQYLLRGDRRIDAADGNLAGRSNRRRDCAGVSDHGRGRRYVGNDHALSRDLSGPVPGRRHETRRSLCMRPKAGVLAVPRPMWQGTRRLRASIVPVPSRSAGLLR